MIDYCCLKRCLKFSGPERLMFGSSNFSIEELWDAIT